MFEPTVRKDPTFHVCRRHNMAIRTKIPLGPFYPIQKDSSLFAMSAGDIFFQYDELTSMHREQRNHSFQLVGMFQTITIFMGDIKDSAALYSTFLDKEWIDSFEWLYGCFHSTGLPIIQKENLHFLPPDTFYSDLAQLEHKNKNITVGAFCHENHFLSSLEGALQISQIVNSKMELARNANRYDIPIPPTLVTTKQRLHSGEVFSFIDDYGPEVMMKISGLGGSFNVKRIQSPDEALRHIEEFSEETEVLLQKQLGSSEYREMTVDFVITDKECKIDNTREVLFADGMWVGNHLKRDLSLSEKQKEILLRCAKWLQSEGYCHPNGFVCGADFFLGDNDLQVIEINGRWTGGQTVERAQKKLDVGSEDVYAFMDKLSFNKMKEYQRFVNENLYTIEAKVDTFKLFPLGIAPHIKHEQENEVSMVWIMVIGDIQAFVTAKEEALGAKELPTSNQVAATAQNGHCSQSA